MGYATCEKGYRVFDPITKKLILSRDIVFDEEAVWNWKMNTDQLISATGNLAYGDTNTEINERRMQTPTLSTTHSPRRVSSIEDSTQSKTLILGESVNISNLDERDNQAFDHTPLKWKNLNEVLAQCNLCIMDPENYADAKQDESWLKAMEDELFMIEKNGTWEAC